MAYTDIDKPTDYFNTKLYTGTGATQSISSVGFQPDWTWLKVRSAGSGQDHTLYDSVRGATKFIESNTTNVEATGANYLTSFDIDGFTLGNDQSHVNGNGDTYVSWNWLADNTSGSSNTDGSTTSTVSANTTSGFSIVKYTGDGTNTATIGHGLGTTPSMVIMRPLDYIGAWWITHKNLSTDNVLEFNTNAQTSYSSFGGGGLRQSQYTDLIITGGAGSSNSDLWNQSGQDYIAYCFAEKKGYSKFGNYVGSGTQANDYGNQIYCGFRPKMIMVKQSDAVRDWLIYDTSRLGYNDRNDLLFPNKSDTEFATDRMMLLSNGFAPRNDSAELNADGGTYIYWAFAENPFVTSTGIPACAR